MIYVLIGDTDAQSPYRASVLEPILVLPTDYFAWMAVCKETDWTAHLYQYPDTSHNHLRIARPLEQ